MSIYGDKDFSGPAHSPSISGSNLEIALIALCIFGTSASTLSVEFITVATAMAAVD